MSTDTAHDVVSKDHAENHAENHGMSNAGYIRIAAILAAITALEVSTVYIDFGPFFLPALLIMMAVIMTMMMIVAMVMTFLFNSVIH